MGFLQICSGVVLLQLSKSAKDVPDTAVLKGDLDQVRTVAEQEEPEYEPRADTIRGSAAILRSLSTARHQRELEEAKQIQEERLQPLGEHEIAEWDGLRRRRTIVGTGQPVAGIQRQKTIHPPLGMSRFPDPDDDNEDNESMHPGFFSRLRSISKPKTPQSNSMPLEGLSAQRRGSSRIPSDGGSDSHSGTTREHIYGLPEGLRRDPQYDEDTAYKPHESAIHWSQEVLSGPNAAREVAASSPSLVPPRPPPHTAKRQFSFQNVFHRHKSSDASERAERPLTSRSHLSFSSKKAGKGTDGATEEERLGLVTGDSRADLFDERPEEELRRETTSSPPGYISEDWQMPRKLGDSDSQVSPGASGVASPRRLDADSDEGSSEGVPPSLGNMEFEKGGSARGAFL